MRLVVWCIAFIVGDALALEGVLGLRGGILLALTGAAIVGTARGRRALLAGPFVMLVAGVLLGVRAQAPRAINPVLAAAFAAGEPVSIEGEVVRGPEDTGPGARVIVALARIDGRAASGRLGLSVMQGWLDVGPGEIVACRAKLREIRGTRNPGLPDPMLGLRAAGIDALAGVADAAAIVRIGEPVGAGPRRWAFLARRALRAAIDGAVGGDAGALLRTAVLGDRRGVDARVEDGFRAAGATHVLSVSGLHLAAVAALFFVAVRWAAAHIPRLPLYVDPRAIAAAASLPAIAFYTLLTGEAIATCRSALMLAIGMLAFLVGRAPSPGPTIAAAAILLLVWQPLSLWDVSLQLSLASVAGIALLASGLVTGGSVRTGRLRRWLRGFWAATAAATAATAPLVAHHFGEVVPLAPLGNLALVPLVEVALVPVGLAGATAAAFWAPLGKWPLAAAGLVARGAIEIADGFRRYAPVWICRFPNAFETAALVAALALALLALSRTNARRAAAWAAVAALLAAAASLAARDHRRRHADQMTVTFLDVGQGDAAVVEAPGGAVMLIDGGGARDGLFDPGVRIVEPFLRARGISRLEVVALSHPHPDHMNGLFRILERFDVGALWSSGDDGRNPQYRRLVELAAARGVPMPEVGPAAVGGAWVTPLGPFAGSQAEERIAAPEGLTVNDASLVLRVGFAGRAVLFSGDLEQDGEGELAGRRDTGQAVASDVIKVPHHGSKTSSTPELIEAVRPELAVMSLGWRNQFGFPAPQVVGRYVARGARVLRTDRDGAVTVVVSPDGVLSVQCERGCP